MLYEFTNQNKHGNLRTRIIPWPDGKPFGYNPKGLGKFQSVKVFKYIHKHEIQPPSLLTLNGKTYIMPTWTEVLPETTLNDIIWEKPIVKKATVEEFKFESSSSGSVYTTKKHISAKGEIKFSCNCPGTWRAKDRRCKHIKEIE